ncbi:MAG: hypothetical protein EAZ95_03245 [Bacteroidetes bacterium]|nr:MAG: hypothetical protein EAZ95_03245 [Bacteroidota bacterium]
MKKVSNTVEVDLSDKQWAILKGIDAEDYSFVVKFAEKELRSKGLIPIPAEDAVYALKQYYAIGAINSANMHAISDVVDPYWHAHILDTPRYKKFCSEVMGYYMHHEPLDHDKPEDVRIMATLYDYTLEVLRTVFGENVNPLCWEAQPADARLVCNHVTGPVVETSLFPPDKRFVYAREHFAHIK